MVRVSYPRQLLGALALTGVLLTAGCASGGGGHMTGASAGTAEVVIFNNSNETVYRIFMSPATDDSWGPDQLGNDVLAVGSSFRLTGIAPGDWDLKIVDRSGNHMEFRHQRLRAGRVYTLKVESSGWTAGG